MEWQDDPDISFDKRTWYLDLNTKQWTQGPDLLYGRADHTCSLVTKPSRKIVIAGGTRMLKKNWKVHITSGPQACRPKCKERWGTGPDCRNLCQERDAWYNQRIKRVDILDLDKNQITQGE